MAIVFVALGLLLGTPALHADQSNASASQVVDLPSNPPPPDRGEVIYTMPQGLSNNEFWLSTMVLALGFVALGLAFTLLRSRRISADDMIKLISMILIIVGTLFLITASFTAQQIAPAMGLFGTIAGYLLGKSAGTDQKLDPKPEKGRDE